MNTQNAAHDDFKTLVPDPQLYESLTADLNLIGSLSTKGLEQLKHVVSSMGSDIGDGIAALSLLHRAVDGIATSLAALWNAENLYPEQKDSVAEEWRIAMAVSQLLKSAVSSVRDTQRLVAYEALTSHKTPIIAD